MMSSTCKLQNEGMQRLPGMCLGNGSLEPCHAVIHRIQAAIEHAEQILNALTLHSFFLHHMLQLLKLAPLIPAPNHVSVHTALSDSMLRQV